MKLPIKKELKWNSCLSVIIGILVYISKFVKKATPVVACGLIVAIPLAGIGAINVASASPDSGSKIPEDYYDETAEWFDCGIDFMSFCKGFNAADKPLNEPIEIPDNIMKALKDKMDYDKEIINIVKASPTDLAVWFGAGSTETKLIKPYLVYLDTDGDNKPEELAAVYNYPYKDTLFFDDFSNIEGHYKFIPYGYVKNPYGGFGVVINPFDAPENLGGVRKLIYIENPDKIQVLPDKTIPWKEAIGKTPAELGLDKDDKGIFGRTPSQTSSPAESTPSEVPEGEENGIPGFEAIFAVAGLLAVAYIFRGRDK